MHSKVIAALASALVIACMADAQAERPTAAESSEGICTEFAYNPYRTPGLQALCVNYCERRDCPNSDDPECGRLLDNYNRRRTENDPEMPCLEVCPCYSAEEVWNHPVELTRCDQTPYGGLPFSAIFDEAQTSGAGSGVNFCMWTDFTVEPKILRSGPVTDRNGAVCRAIVDAVIAERGLICD